MYNQGELVAGTNGKTFKTVQYRGCGKFGHYVSSFPEAAQHHVNVEEKQEGEEEMNNEVTLQQMNELDVSSNSDPDSDDSYRFYFSFYQDMIFMTNVNVGDAHLTK